MTTQGIQIWTAPRSGSYQITAIGAAGGNGPSSTAGAGARMIGTFSLSQGQKLRIAVGQTGATHTSLNGGGGGGSFVMRETGSATSDILVIAGGGGGGGYTNNGTTRNANTGTSSQPGWTGNTNVSLNNGQSSGNGGLCNDGSGGGGGGLTGDGGSSLRSTDVTAGKGGKSFINGLVAGSAIQSSQRMDGGFGGGGSGDWNYWTGAGGGGGYSGGSGGYYYGGGGGGASYNNGASQSNSTGIGTAMGSVTITSLTSQPDPPTNLFATAGFTSAVVTFTPPVNNGGATITSYTVTSSPGSITATGGGSPITVNGLTNGTTYTFTVTATNSVGTSVASAASNQATPFTVPGAPRSVTAVAGNGEATVNFLPPVTNGGNSIFEYMVISTPDGLTATGFESPLTVTGLTNGTSYTFIAEARNLGGFGADSAPSAAIVVGVPSQPLNPLATAGIQQATVTFDPPATDNGSAISSYSVTASPGGATEVAPAPTGSIIVGSLSTNTSYTFTVAATNTAGTGPSSLQTQAILLGIPDAPTGVTATPGAAEASVAFTPGADNGSTITQFRVTASPGGIAATGSSSPINVTGLTNGVAYTFMVRATNSVANSAESAPSAPVTPLDVPGAPTITLAAPAGSGQALVYFTAPGADGGSAITNYTVTSSPDGITGTGSTSPITVTGLTDTTTYTFTMVATNDQGDSVPSAPSNSIVAGTTVPDPPTNVLAVQSGDRSVTVSWDAPLNDGGLPITTYRIVSQPGIAPTTSATSPITLGNLLNTPYTFQVIAVNVVGDSAASTATSAVQPLFTANVSLDAAPDILLSQPVTGGAVAFSGAGQKSLKGVAKLGRTVAYFGRTGTAGGIAPTGLTMHLNAGVSASYSGSGTTWTNLATTGGWTGTLAGSPLPTFVSAESSFQFASGSRVTISSSLTTNNLPMLACI